MTNPKDSEEVMIMAYGVHPSGRNLDKERSAIIIFKSIYGYIPVYVREDLADELGLYGMPDWSSILF